MYYVSLRENLDDDIVSMADFLVVTERAESRNEALRQLMREGISHLSQTETRLMVDPEPNKITSEPVPEFQFNNPETVSKLTDYKLLIMENKELRGQLNMVANELQRLNRMWLKKQFMEQAEENIQRALKNTLNSAH